MELQIKSVERVRGDALRIVSATDVEGFGEPLPPDAQLPRLEGQSATAREALRSTVGAALWPAVEMACLDLLGKAIKAPAYQVLGGPTRHKVRILTPLLGDTDEILRVSLLEAQARGAAAFAVPAPPYSPARGFIQTVVRRLETLRKAGGENADFVLKASGALTAGEAGRVARAIEGFHLMWFDEPCAAGNLAALRKIAEETVTPLGFGATITTAAQFQELLRHQVIDVVRPDLRRFSLTDARRIAALAEAYYVGVAPIGAASDRGHAAAIHLAASLPNFFIQEARLERMTAGYVDLPAGVGISQ